MKNSILILVQKSVCVCVCREREEGKGEKEGTHSILMDICVLSSVDCYE